MKLIYANYCALALIEVPDDYSDEDIENALSKEYASRGFDIDRFDDGEWEAKSITTEGDNA